MKQLLTSSGITTQEIADALEELVGKSKNDISFAIINEAHCVEDGDKTWIVDELVNLKKHFPGMIDFIDLFALRAHEIIERVKNCDVIYVLGGNTDYLMKVYNDSNFGKLLCEQFKDKPYLGSSAGSMVMCKRVSTEAYEKIYGEANDFGINQYLNLNDFAIKPHLNSSEFPNNTEKFLTKVSKTFDRKIFGLKDDQAIVVNDGEIFFVGGEIFSC